MSGPRGSGVLVPPDSTAAVHLIWGNLENGSETPASVAGGDPLAKPCTTCRGFLAAFGVSCSSDYLCPSSSNWLRMFLTVFRFGFRGDGKRQRKHISVESWILAAPEVRDIICCIRIIASVAQ